MCYNIENNFAMASVFQKRNSRFCLGKIEDVWDENF